MSILVMKFGGTSVATLDRIRRAAKRVGREVANGHDVIVIVSAMAGKTNELVGWVEETSKFFDAREYDAVVSSGENVTAGLMSLTLQEMDVPARSWQGWQVPLKTTSAHSAARIVEIPTANITAKFAEGMRVAVVAGFQGISPEGRITTLGRGGSDTTAVAFAAAFGAVRCDIYTDVDGVYTTDPRITLEGAQARPHRLRGDARTGQPRRQGAPDPVGRAGDALQREAAGPLELRGQRRGRGHACLRRGGYRGIERGLRRGLQPRRSQDDADRRSPTAPASPRRSSARWPRPGVNVDMIVQNISEGGHTDMTFSCPVNEVPRAEKAMTEAKTRGEIDFEGLVADTDVAKVSVVGIGMRSHAGVASQMFKALSAEGINIKVITTSEIKISVLIDRKYLELAVQALHDAFGLERAG